jgi:uncharacterized membrane protein
MPQPAISETNVERIIRLEGETEEEQRPGARVAEAIGFFAGTIWFVLAAIVCCALWVALNLNTGAFDPYPFPLLAVALAMVSLILTSFVLIRQNRMSRRADLRNHLALQINLLAEQESTEILQVLQKLSRRLGIAEAVDRDTEELALDAPIEQIARNLRENIDEAGKPR